MPDAISYKRFSAPQQARGDTIRRQTDLADDYCRRHGLRLIDTYLDAGLSAYEGENLSDGTALSILLNGAREGRFKPGTHLIVESLDRLSRSEISTAVRLFLDILDMGLVIVTLIDGEQVFTKERVDTDVTALIIPIVILSRANNESRNRKERLAQARQNAMRSARELKIPITKQCPSWLSVIGRRNTRRFVVDEDRAEIVRRVFMLATGDMGQNLLARHLNQQNIPTLTGRPSWRTPMVAHLLRDRAVLGIYHPKRRVLEGGMLRRLTDPDGPIEDYYPPIVAKDLWDAAQYARVRRHPTGRARTERQFSNLVPRLGRCAVCGDLLSLTHGGSRVPYLHCTGSNYGDCSNHFGFPYRNLEAVLLSLDGLTEAIARLVAERIADTEVSSRIAKLDARLTRTRRRLDQLVASVAKERDSTLHATNARVERLHAEVERQQRLLNAATREPLPGHSDQGRFLPRFEIAKSSLGASELREVHLARGIIVAELRRLLEGVVLDNDRIITIHMKGDTLGYRAVYELRPEGLQGAHVKIVDGSIGFIEADVLKNIVSILSSPQETNVSLDALLHSLQIIRLSNGNWKAVMPGPFQMAEIVSRAEKVLASAARL